MSLGQQQVTYGKQICKRTRAKFSYAFREIAKHFVALALVLIAFPVSLAHAQTYEVGAIAAEVGVSPSGGATYTVPITVPPGTTGVQPKIALQYNSHSGNGVVGVGWSIAGQSAITRCPTDLYYDSSIDPVDFDTNDKLCLNGQRLEVVSGTYGADGAEYRTAFASFQKIVGYGPMNSSYSWFRVWKKSGEVLDYGFDVNSRILGNYGTMVQSWSLHKVWDRYGNYLKYTYAGSATNDYRLHRIDYTGNDLQGLVPYNYVLFEYETRPDIIKAFQGGDSRDTTLRLSSIKAYASGALTRDYQLTYSTGATGRSRLTSLKECAPNATCFVPTNFAFSQDGYGSFTQVLAPSYIAGGNWANYQVLGTGDFNGDGLTDFYVAPVDEFHRHTGGYNDYVWLAKGDGKFNHVAAPSYLSGTNWQYASVLGSGDFNGDGLTDLYVGYTDQYGRRNSAYDYVWLSDGDGTFSHIVTPTYLAGNTWANFKVLSSGDFNGDGLTDFYVAQVDEFGRHTGNYYDYVWLAKGDGYFDFVAAPSYLQGANWQYATVAGTGDFNGDGLTDLYVAYVDQYGRRTSSMYDYIWLAKGDGTFSHIGSPSYISGGNWQNYKILSSGDFNGDGLTDFYVAPVDEFGRHTGNYYDYVWLAKGNGNFDFVQAPSYLQNTNWQYSSIVGSGDFNGDGLTDLYVAHLDQYGRRTSSMSDYIWLAKGDGKFSHVYAPSYVSGGSWENYDILGFGDFNGDGLTDLYVASVNMDGRLAGSYYDYTWLSSYKSPDLLTSATNGMGLKSEFVYKPMTDATVYAKGTGAAYPVQDQIGATPIVAEVKADDGIGGMNTQRYHHSGLRAHVRGLGSLGFEKTTVTDLSTGMVTESVYSQDWANHHQGLLQTSKTIAPNQTVLTEKTVAWQTRWLGAGDQTVQPGQSRRCFRFTPHTVTINRDLNGVFTGSVSEETTYDNYGFATQTKVTTQNGTDRHVVTTNNVYNHDTNDWILGKLTVATAIHHTDGQTDISRTSSFTYDSVGQVLAETIDPGTPLQFTKTYARNGFGATTSVTESWDATGGDGMPANSRVTAYTYDVWSRFRVSETNPLGHTQTNTHHPVTGLVTSTTGPNGLTTYWSYDDFGRKRLETRADNTTTTINYIFCSAPTIICPANAKFAIHSIGSDGSNTISYKDGLYRDVRTDTTIAGGSQSRVETTYDALGRVLHKSEPYTPGNTVYNSTILYDILGRPIRTIAPDGSVQEVQYNGLTQTGWANLTTGDYSNVYDPNVSANANNNAQSKIVTKDVMGRQIAITDNTGQVITYNYDAIGQVTSMVNGGVSQSFTYDARGNKITDTDPDKGTWTYSYNALGLLTQQTNAKGQVTTMTYDLLGRTITRIDDATAPNPQDRTATWVYDTSPTAGIGKLHTVTDANTTTVSTYDALGRPLATTETIEGSSYTSSTTYDSQSRPQTITYPNGHAISNVYDAWGQLIEVVNAANTSLKYWERKATDARGNVTWFTLGDGTNTYRTFTQTNGRLERIASSNGVNSIQDLNYTFDLLGNLTSRADARQDLEENFFYDSLNRVIQTDTITGVSQGGTTQTTTVNYDHRGNITYKSDIGNYTYGTVDPSCTGGGPASPHAVAAITGTKNTVYCYDANGNMTSGDGRAVTYSAFDKPVQITRATSTVTFAYGPDRARYKRIDQTQSATTTTVYAAGGTFEKISSGGTVTEKVYIGDFAVVTKTITQQATTNTTNYLHRDHLGSVDTITDQSGVVMQRLSFDTWGKRREINWQAMTVAAIATFDTTLTTRGYTGHEMVDAVGLVHMNGRVYDPEIGKFLSADPHIQDTSNLQNWNRYSYVLNNPLSYTDPSGFIFNKIADAIGNFFESVFRAVGNVLKKVLNNPLVRTAIQIVGCAVSASIPGACAAISAGLSAAGVWAAGGALGDAIQAVAMSFASMASFAVAGNVVSGLASAVVEGAKLGVEAATAAFTVIKAGVHGAVGGALSVAQGGNFLEGFAGSALGAVGGIFSQGVFGAYGTGDFSNVIGRATISAAVGCAGAVLSGGKCGNGAITAAYASLFNGDSDFWKKGLANAFIGMDAEQTLRNHLQSRDGAEMWGSQVAAGDGRADLLHNPSGDVFEVKSFGSKRDAVGQLQDYIDALGPGHQAGSFSRISKTGSLQLQSTGFLSGLGAKYTYSPVQLGVVGWTLNNPMQVQARAMQGAGFVANLIASSLLRSRGIPAPLPR